MKSKLSTLLIAIILGLVASASTALYIRSINQSAIAGEKLKEIYIAKKAVPKGEILLDAVAKKLILAESVPLRFVAEDALSPNDDLKDLVLINNMSKGEQVTSTKVKKPGQAELAIQVPKDKIAISVPTDELVGISGNLKGGDRVNVIATFSPGQGGKDITRTLLRNVLVLSTSNEEASGKNINSKTQKSTLQKSTLTLAVSQVEAEKLVFAEEKGHVWLALLPVGYKDEGIATIGRTVDSVFD